MSNYKITKGQSPLASAAITSLLKGTIPTDSSKPQSRDLNHVIEPEKIEVARASP